MDAAPGMLFQHPPDDGGAVDLGALGQFDAPESGSRSPGHRQTSETTLIHPTQPTNGYFQATCVISRLASPWKCRKWKGTGAPSWQRFATGLLLGANVRYFMSPFIS